MADFKTANLCGAGAELTSILSKVDDIFADILAGLEDTAGSVIAALESAMDSLASTLSSLMPDISDLIPDISFQAEMSGLLKMVSGSLEYLAKLAELTLKFGETLLGMGLNILDLVADGAAALLKGLDPCSVIPNLTQNAAGEIASRPNAIATATEAAVVEVQTGLVTKTKITRTTTLLAA